MAQVHNLPQKPNPQTVGAFDNRGGGGDDHNMNAMTREEMTAHLQATEARMEARFARIETIAEHFDRTTADIKADMKEMRLWIVGTGIAVVLGVAAFNATVLSNMVASFESGKNTAQILSETQKRLDEMAKQLTTAPATPNKN